MQKDIFQCEGPAGNIEFDIDGESFCISEAGKSKCLIPCNTLRHIEFRNHPWIIRNDDMSFRLSVMWTNGSEEQRKDILLFHDRRSNMDFVRFLKSRYPDQCVIGPNEKERETLFNQSGKNIYRLYALGLATTLGIISVILLIQIIFLTLSLTTSQFVDVSNPDTFYRTGKILCMITLIPLSLFILIIAKKVMIVKTDQQGLTIQRIVTRRTLTWEEIELGNVTTETSNIYTGLFCYYSDQVNVLTSRNFMEIPLMKRTGESVSVKMSMDEAGRFYRELYYRGKVSLEEAKGVKAFL